MRPGLVGSSRLYLANLAQGQGPAPGSQPDLVFLARRRTHRYLEYDERLEKWRI